ncbi:MAG: phage tail protein [Bryobacteraceae bacterium]
MQTVSELKAGAITDTPLVIFDCVLPNGDGEHWCTHGITIGTTSYAARVLQHSAFDIQTASDQGVDGSPTITLLLANADSHFSEIERSTGFRGAQITVSFVFYDLRNNVPLTDAVVVFQGICNPPDQIKEATFRVSATNRMSMQRVFLPEIRIQRLCPWTFPSTPAQQQEAVDGGAEGSYSLYYPCGYSAGLPGGCGNLNDGVPFTSCGYASTDCQARGMFMRFGGIEYIPPVITVRGYGKDWTSSAVAVNQARYNDYVPMAYGTTWYYPPVVFARNDGNLTRMEVLLGIGQIQGVLTVLVNGYQIPLGVSGQNMTGTGWYNIPTLGTRNGAFDMNFLNSSGQAAGDAYGGMAYLSVAVPNQISDGNSLPSVQVLVQGLIVPTYDAQGNQLSQEFSSNPVWILHDILRRSGWQASEIDYSSLASAAAYCDERISSTDLNGNPINIARFGCNVILQKRRSAGDVIRGIRNASRLFLTYGAGGVLQINAENTMALQQPAQNSWSNSTESLNGGWPAYEFGDGTTGVSGILRKSTGEPSVVVSSRSIADTPNSLSIDYQDELNSYQQDSYTVVDPDDVTLTGQQVTGTLMAIGLPNYDQAARILTFNLDKSLAGNTYVQIETSIMAFGIRPGDLITVTYQKEGFNRQAFRVLRITPATNFRTAVVTAQIHEDAWYLDSNGQTSSAAGAKQQATASIGLPRPLPGSVVDPDGVVEFGIAETATTNSDGTIQASLAVSFVAAKTATAGGPGIPLVSLVPTIGTGGTLMANQVLYYAVSGVDAAGDEGALSFVVTALIASDGSSVTLTGLSFAPGTSNFNVYRGTTPAELLRIASSQAIGTSFHDSGVQPQLIAPPDANFDHANFYWRMELQPEMAAAIFSPTTVGNGNLQMGPNGYQGMTARLTRGTGAGQEASIASNDATTLTLSSAWVVPPDATSYFVVAESGWHFGAKTKSSPVSLVVPNQGGETVHVTGRSANAVNVECPPLLSTVTRWQIGGSGFSDSGAPPTPFFGLSAGKTGGTLDLSGVSFSSLTDTETVSAATLTVYYWDELQGATGFALADAIGTSETTLTLSTPGPAQAGGILQIDSEVLEVTAVGEGGVQYTVQRGVHSSPASAHAQRAAVYHLAGLTATAGFPQGFFGSPYSGTWSFPITLSDARVASAQLFVTNQKGNSPTASVCLTHTVDSGLRTLSGGQYSIQVEGFLSIDQSAAPALVVEAAHSVGDIYGVLGAAADETVQLQLSVNGSAYCQLVFQANETISSDVSGQSLPPLATGDQITLAVQSVGQTYPGADLTVIIRL